MFQGRLVCVTRRLFFDTEMATKRVNTKRSVHTVALPPLVAERITCTLSKWTGEPGRCQWCDTSIDSPRRRTWCVRTNVVGHGSASTSGDSPARRQNVARSTAASAPDVRLHGATARSTTSLPATGMAMVLVAIITSCPMRAATVVSRCSVVRITPRSPRHRRPRVPRHGERPSWPVKLRSSRGVS